MIDTGINLSHPDLNAVSGKDCVDLGTPAEDGNGHGTHVSGTIGAKNNGAGVTGVAPGTRIYAVRVLNNAGSGIVRADHLRDRLGDRQRRGEEHRGREHEPRRGPRRPAVGLSRDSDAMHLAICNATDANTNVTFVVAAGNSAWDFDFAPNPDVPAAYKEVLTVTAMSDSDGKPGCARAASELSQRRVRRSGGPVLELRRHGGRPGAHDRRAGHLHQVDLARGRLQHDLRDEHGAPAHGGRRGALSP